MSPEKAMTIEDAQKMADDDGKIEVVAAIKGVFDNGVKYDKGQRFRMLAELVPGHVAAGQVALAAGAEGAAET